MIILSGLPNDRMIMFPNVLGGREKGPAEFAEIFLCSI